MLREKPGPPGPVEIYELDEDAVDVSCTVATSEELGMETAKAAAASAIARTSIMLQKQAVEISEGTDYDDACLTMGQKEGGRSSGKGWRSGRS